VVAVALIVTSRGRMQRPDSSIATVTPRPGSSASPLGRAP
jgi:hypothetical protein